MPTADAHLHLFAAGFAGLTGSSAAGEDELLMYERLRALHGIERGLVIGYEGEPRYAGNNAEVLALARSHPWITPLLYLPADPAPTVDALREAVEAGAAGFSIYLADAPAGRSFAGWPAAAFAELNAQHAIVSFNATPAAIACLAAAVDALDGCALLFSHLGLPGPHARVPRVDEARERLRPLLSLAGRDHVAVKLSGLYAISEPAHDYPHAAADPFVALALDRFGPERLLWGSDFAPALDFVSFAQLADARPLAQCAPHEVDAVMGGNLLRIVKARNC